MATDIDNKAIENDGSDENAINIKELLFMCLHYWYWFAISVVICVGLGVFYLLRTPNVYTVSAQLLVKENTKGMNSSMDFGSFDNFDLFQSKSNINNEIATISSPDMMEEVVKILHLDINYAVKSRFHRNVLYGTDLPITAYVAEMPKDTTISFKVSLLPDSAVVLSDFKKGRDEISSDDCKGIFSHAINTPLGEITIVPTTVYTFPTEDDEIYVSCASLKAATTYYCKELSVTQEDEKSSVINISVKDVSIQRATALINTLIVVYNKKWVDDRNQIAMSTSNFIDERLGVIESELGNVDNEISSYKSANLLPDLQAASNMYMQQATQANNEILELNNQLEMARMVRAYLTEPDKQFQLLPVNTGFENASLATQINNYNQQVINRNSLVANSSTSNPIVVDLDNALVGLRSAIISSIDNQIETLRGQLRTQQKREGQAISQISHNPQQAKYLLSVERQQMVKESLYLFLLQKREENELSQAFTAYNNRVIMEPNCSGIPTSPVRRNIYLLSFIIGLLIPTAVIYIRAALNTKVRGRKDLESLTAPFIGEIPQTQRKGEKQSAIDKLLKKKGPEREAVVVVKEGSRNVINEAFRVIRANLEFMSGEANKVISITSANPGSGKTFISFNLALSFALKGKRVLVIDLDLRKGSLSKYADSPKKGFTDYIVGREGNINSLIVKGVKGTKLDMLPMGTMPPNPTELLYSPRFTELINELRDEYDLIFIDCPPAEIVADAAIINKVVDLTLFIIRSGLFERGMLTEVQGFYNSGKYKNLSIILNGTESGSGRYGYRYGYKYGYSYGYGHYGGYTKDDE